MKQVFGRFLYRCFTEAEEEDSLSLCNVHRRLQVVHLSQREVEVIQAEVVPHHGVLVKSFLLRAEAVRNRRVGDCSPRIFSLTRLKHTDREMNVTCCTFQFHNQSSVMFLQIAVSPVSVRLSIVVILLGVFSFIFLL